jgi:hypothetical protein
MIKKNKMKLGYLHVNELMFEEWRLLGCYALWRYKDRRFRGT